MTIIKTNYMRGELSREGMGEGIGEGRGKQSKVLTSPGLAQKGFACPGQTQCDIWHCVLKFMDSRSYA